MGETTDLLSDLEQVTSVLNALTGALICVVVIITLTWLCKNRIRINSHSLQHNYRILLFVSEVAGYYFCSECFTLKTRESGFDP